MKYRPSTPFIICLVPMLAVAGTAGWAWSKVNSVPAHKRADMSFFDALRYRENDRRIFEEPTPEQLAAVRPQVIELKQKMLAEFPDLAITGQPVPDEENGFLLFYELTQGSGRAPGETMPVTPELRNFLNPAAAWDPVAIRAALEANGDLIAKIEHIAALPKRSSANMPADYNGFISARDMKVCSDILLMKARLAADAKDETEALRLVTANFHLASHCDQAEAVSLLGVTVGILIDLQVEDAILTKLLPALGRDADLPRWRAALTSRPPSTVDRFSNVLRGDWHATGVHLLFPTVLAMKDRPEDYEELIRAYTSQFDSFSKMIQGQNHAILLNLPAMPSPKVTLSSKSREILEMFNIGNTAWGKGYARASSIRARNLAALDLLVLEKSGTALTAESVSTVTPEPLSGEAFVYDPATRTISAPPAIAEEAGVIPLALPW